MFSADLERGDRTEQAAEVIEPFLDALAPWERMNVATSAAQALADADVLKSDAERAVIEAAKAHRPYTIEAHNDGCTEGRCDHEDECPLHEMVVCRACYELGVEYDDELVRDDVLAENCPVCLAVDALGGTGDGTVSRRTATNRILWNRRGHDIDEIVLNAEWVHVEQMDDRCWWIGIDLPDGGYWAGNFTADSRGRMRFAEQEMSGFTWEQDASHDDWKGEG